MKLPSILLLRHLSTITVLSSSTASAFRRCWYRVDNTQMTTIVSKSTPLSSASSDTTVGIVPQDIQIICSDGIQLAAQVWSIGQQSQQQTPYRRRLIVCLHGWMDNCRSFHYLAPNLLVQLQEQHQKNSKYANDDDKDHKNTVHTEILALDLPGHGWSSHKSLDGPPILFSESIFYVAEAIQQYTKSFGANIDTAQNNEKESSSSSSSPNNNNDKNIILIGHSMGGAISCLYAATYPEQIQQLIVLDSAGPMARNTQDFVKHLRQSTDKRLSSTKTIGGKHSSQQQKQQQRIYSSIHEAVKVRMLAPKQFPGQQYISEVTATELVLRGTKPLLVANGSEDDEITPPDPDVNSSKGTTTSNGNNIQGYTFQHDVRLQWPSIQYYTQEQVDTIYQNILCPTILLIAQDGFPFTMDKQLHLQKQFEKQSSIIIKTLPGSHHFHSDPDSCTTVLQEITNFITTTTVSSVAQKHEQ